VFPPNPHHVHLSNFLSFPRKILSHFLSYFSFFNLASFKFGCHCAPLRGTQIVSYPPHPAISSSHSLQHYFVSLYYFINMKVKVVHKVNYPLAVIVLFVCYDIAIGLILPSMTYPLCSLHPAILICGLFLISLFSHHIIMYPLSSFHYSLTDPATLLCVLHRNSWHLYYYSVSPPQILWVIIKPVKVLRFSFRSHSLKSRDSRKASSSLGIDFFQKMDLMRAVSKRV